MTSYMRSISHIVAFWNVSPETHNATQRCTDRCGVKALLHEAREKES